MQPFDSNSSSGPDGTGPTEPRAAGRGPAAPGPTGRGTAAPGPTGCGPPTFGLIFDDERPGGGPPQLVRSPFDQHEVAEVHHADWRLLEEGLDIVHRAFPSIARQPAHRRAGWLRAMARELEERADTLVRTLIEEAGKPVRYARAEVADAVAALLRAAELTQPRPGEARQLDGAPPLEQRLSLTERRAVGPVVSICPFSEPLGAPAREIASALAAGCSILVKPSSHTPISALHLGRIALAAGVPPGTVVVTPAQAQDASVLVEDQRQGVVSFSGSAEVGWHLRRQTGRRLLSSLGDLPAAIIESDADAETAATVLATAAFACAGQHHCALQRVLIHERMAGRFYDRFLQVVSGEIATGDPVGEDVHCGPMIDAAQADRVLEWIDQASAGEARVLIPPQRSGSLLSPAVVAKAPSDLPLVTRQVFGPVVVLETYRGISRGLERLNAHPPGGVVSIFSQDVRKVLLVQKEARARMIVHNDSLFSIPPHIRDDAASVSAGGMGIGDGLERRIAAFSEDTCLFLRRDASGRGWLR